MIYLDNAATTFPKPLAVRQAMNNSFSYCANPGRAGHKLSIKASEAIFNCRNRISQLFNFDKPENIILTSGCTFALNTVIKGVLRKGDHVVISSLEHNSVVRPLEKLSESGFITYSVAEVFECDDDKTLDSFRKAFKDKTKLVVCTHASNVFGIKLPISRIGALCRYYGILFCVDAAQTAGLLSINISDTSVDYLCIAGHKGLYGPMGTGALLINTETIPDSLCEGGTGSSSLNSLQPEVLPDKFESGTVNLHGMSGLSSGIEFVSKRKVTQIFTHEILLIKALYHNLNSMENVILYTKEPSNEFHVPLLSFNINGLDSESVAHLLDSKYNIAVRAGIHCSPLAHKYMKTDNIGTVRISPSIFSTQADIKALTTAIYQLSNNKKIFI